MQPAKPPLNRLFSTAVDVSSKKKGILLIFPLGHFHLLCFRPRQCDRHSAILTTIQVLKLSPPAFPHAWPFSHGSGRLTF